MSDLFKRAARIYCAQKGIDPDARILDDNGYYHTNADYFAEQLREFDLKRYCLQQAERTK